MAAPGTILTVCTANICRSPMAAGLLQHALAGQAEPLRSLKIVRKVGIDIAGLRSRPVTREMVEQAVVVLCMTEAHRAMLQLTIDPPPTNLFLFREFMPREADKEIGDFLAQKGLK